MQRRSRILLYTLLTLPFSAARPQTWQGVELDPDRLIRPALLARALRSFEAHRDSNLADTRIAIVDFAKASFERRLFLVDLTSGAVTSHLVAHGRGSDADHDARAERFSDATGSHASSLGAYRSAGLYQGQHGLSLALDGLDPSNRSARERAVVLHSQWYVSDRMIQQHNKLGRSWGCFVVDRTIIADLAAALADGGFIYAGD